MPSHTLYLKDRLYISPEDAERFPPIPRPSDGNPPPCPAVLLLCDRRHFLFRCFTKEVSDPIQRYLSATSESRNNNVIRYNNKQSKQCWPRVCLSKQRVYLVRIIFRTLSRAIRARSSAYIQRTIPSGFEIRNLPKIRMMSDEPLSLKNNV